MTKEAIIRKFTSRKLWMALAEFIGMLLIALNVAETTATQVTALILSGGGVIAYVLAEGWADAANGTVTIKDAEDEEAQG